MARFKLYDYRQGEMISLTFEEQFLPGSPEYVLHHLIEERIPDSWFEDLYTNDDTGRRANSPRLLLKSSCSGLRRPIISEPLRRCCAWALGVNYFRTSFSSSWCWLCIASSAP